MGGQLSPESSGQYHRNLQETDTSNHYQGCELTIEDDKGREFTTKNPFIINAVAKMVNTLCVDKLAEIEGEIFIPA